MCVCLLDRKPRRTTVISQERGTPICHSVWVWFCCGSCRSQVRRAPGQRFAQDKRFPLGSMTTESGGTHGVKVIGDCPSAVEVFIWPADLSGRARSRNSHQHSSFGSEVRKFLHNSKAGVKSKTQGKSNLLPIYKNILLLLWSNDKLHSRIKVSKNTAWNKSGSIANQPESGDFKLVAPTVCLQGINLMQ